MDTDFPRRRSPVPATSRLVAAIALAAAAAIPGAARPCGGAYEECCTTGAACGEHLECDESCALSSWGLTCGVWWAPSGPGVCMTTTPPPTEPTGICAPDELQCGVDCALVDYDMSPVCTWGGPAEVTVDSWCYSEYEGPFYACPVGPVEGGGTRYACSYVNGDPFNCGQCGVVCPGGTWCSSGLCR